MKRSVLMGLVVLGVLSLAACATIIAGQDQQMSIISEPICANV
jgi:predicted small secreted protein